MARLEDRAGGMLVRVGELACSAGSPEFGAKGLEVALELALAVVGRDHHVSALVAVGS